jgi:DNA-binding NtrC family response regulator
VQGTRLAGHSILIVEDEPLIALSIRMGSRRRGPAPSQSTLTDATRHVEQNGLSGAVLDYRRRSQDGDALCRHLTQRNIPFILHSGYGHTSDACHACHACHGGIVIPNPAKPEVLIQALRQALCQPRSSELASNPADGFDIVTRSISQQ